MSDEQTRSGGDDPNLQGPSDASNVKMTGDAEPGSHSAVFGLTPDGTKHDDTSTGTSAPKPAHGTEGAVGGGKVPSDEEDSTNTSSTESGSGKVAEQMNDPRVAEKGHGGPAVASEGVEGEKPGSGVGLQQQGGQIKEGSSGLTDKAKEVVSNDS